MNQQLVEENKQKLLAEEVRLKKIISSDATKDKDKDFPGGYVPNVTDIGTEEGENASESEEFGNELSVVRGLEIKLNKVRSALKRIEDGTYGKCLEGDDIEEDRLRALPEADACIKHSK